MSLYSRRINFLLDHLDCTEKFEKEIEVSFMCTFKYVLTECKNDLSKELKKRIIFFIKEKLVGKIDDYEKKIYKECLKIMGIKNERK